MWRLVAFAVAFVLVFIYGMGWLTAEGPERRRYGWIATAAVVIGYFLRPW